MKKALDIISSHIEKVLSERGFVRQQEENTKEVIFLGQDIAYSIIFDDKTNSFNFRSCSVSDSEVDGEWKKLSEWLFEPGVNTQKDAEMIALDFADTITGSQKKQLVKASKKKKDSGRSVNLNFLVNRLVSFFPELKEDVKYEKENYENFRYVNFIENSVMPKINYFLLETSQKDRIKKFVTLLNNMYSTGNLDVRGIITVVILRSINVENKRELLESFMDEELRKAWKAADNLKGKKIKPEKEKSKARKIFMADTLQK